MSLATFERVAHIATYLVAFAILYAAAYGLDGTAQTIAFVAGAATMHTAGYIRGRTERR